jgi:hypothetical protein
VIGGLLMVAGTRAAMMYFADGLNLGNENGPGSGPLSLIAGNRF